MPRIKKIVTKDVPEEKKPEALVEYLKVVQAYRIQNPVKFEMKKESFLKKLNDLGFKGEL